MSDPIFLTMTGENHGLVSAGCSSKTSIGRYAHVNHEDQIFALSLLSGWGYEKHSERRCMSFHKFIDKSTPLLALGINENERYFLEFDFYRINQFGHFDKYYFIELRGASIVALQMNFDLHSGLDTECITVAYDYIRCRHLVAATEYYHFALPANYNSLFSVQNPIVAARNAAQRSVPKVNVSKPFGTVKTPTPSITPVFAKSCLRGAGCTDAGTAPEPDNNFGKMAFYYAGVPLAMPMPTAGRLPMVGAVVFKWLAGQFNMAGTWLMRISPVAPAGAVVMGLLPGTLNTGEQDFLDRIRLAPIADNRGSAPTRVRFKWVENSQGQLEPRGYHTSPASGLDHVPVRYMTLNQATGNYEFIADGDTTPSIYWNPNKLDLEVPEHTGNEERPYLPPSITVLPLPEEASDNIEIYPAPEENGFRDYILILPIPNIPPLYIYLSKPPTKFLEVELYSDFEGRPREGMHADHMPSSAAVKLYLKQQNPLFSKGEIEEMARNVAAVIIPAGVHQRVSQTYGGRNTQNQIAQDIKNLRAAADRNFDALKPVLKNYSGATEEQLEQARSKLHEINENQGLYK